MRDKGEVVAVGVDVERGDFLCRRCKYRRLAGRKNAPASRSWLTYRSLRHRRARRTDRAEPPSPPTKNRLVRTSRTTEVHVTQINVPLHGIHRKTVGAPSADLLPVATSAPPSQSSSKPTYHPPHALYRTEAWGMLESDHSE